MPADPVVIQALEAGISGSPDNVALRIHIAQVLFAGGEPHLALPHVAHALSLQPASVDALQIAADAAEALGDPRGAAWRQLLQALGATHPVNQPEPSPAGHEPVAAADAGAPIPLRVVDVDDLRSGEVERPRVTLADVGGLEEVKRRLEVSFLGPMRNPQLRATFGKSLRGGLLLWGPPGCGKTFVARATAGELGARFIGVGLSDVLDMWFGNSERNLHEIFETARRNAPCIVFLDELDALGQKRTHTRHQPTWRGVIAQLLAELDGATTSNEGVFVLGATNQRWDVDSALKRPGRFDRSLLVLPPDAPAREAILGHNLEGRPTDPSVKLSTLAGITDNFSGADLAMVCEAATETAMEASTRSGVIAPITQAMLIEAVRTASPSTLAWFGVARNVAMFANEGGAYDDLLRYLRSRRLA